jgi:hypothetical protein
MPTSFLACSGGVIDVPSVKKGVIEPSMVFFFDYFANSGEKVDWTDLAAVGIKRFIKFLFDIYRPATGDSRSREIQGLQSRLKVRCLLHISKPA